MDNQKTRTEEFKVTGGNLLAKAREVIEEGNAQRLILKNEEGHSLFELPLTAGVAAGVVSVAILPALVAIGAIAAIVTHATLVVERRAS